MKTYEISSKMFESFRITVDDKGKVFWCSDDSHPAGADWPSLKKYYESKKGQMKCKIRELK